MVVEGDLRMRGVPTSELPEIESVEILAGRYQLLVVDTKNVLVGDEVPDEWCLATKYQLACMSKALTKQAHRQLLLYCNLRTGRAGVHWRCEQKRFLHNVRHSSPRSGGWLRAESLQVWIRERGLHFMHAKTRLIRPIFEV